MPGEYRARGSVRSEVIDLKNRGTEIVKILWDSIEERGTAVRVYCRVSNRYYAPDRDFPARDSMKAVEPEIPWPSDPRLSHINGAASTEALKDLETGFPQPQWVLVRNDREIADRMLQGRYFQWRAELFGTDGRYTPFLKNLTVVYEPDPPPTAPILLTAVPLDRGVEIRWVRSKEKDVREYRVYYGTRPRHYLGQVPESVLQSDRENQSHVLQDLENDQVYFVSITAVDEADQESGFSRELSVRPSAVYTRDAP
jgi:hypothetical protein